jgi:anti-anti-sigma factor
MARTERLMLPRLTGRGRAGTHGGSLTANELTVNTRQAGDGTIVEISGRITIDSSSHLRPVLHGAIGAAPTGGVVVDFTGTTYLDTSAAATLIEAAMLAHDRSVPLRVVGLTGEPRLLAEVIELDRIFRALESEVELP